MAASKVIEFDTLLKQITGLNGETKALLVNPCISDFRLPWAHWHQPTGLLQLGAFLKQQNIDVRLVDFLNRENQRVARRKFKTIKRGDYSIPFWRFGLASNTDLKARIKRQLGNAWKPNFIFVTSLNSIWWEDVKEAINATRELLPNTPIYLGGLYPTYEPNHAKKFSGADFIVSNPVSEIARFSPDLSLYQSVPKSAGIYFYFKDQNGTLIPRPLDDIIDEIKEKIRLGVLEFAFFDDEIKLEDKSTFIKFLDLTIENKIKTKFALLGNISVNTIDEELAIKMRSARIRKIYFKCNLNFNNKDYFIDTLESYEKGMHHLIRDGKYKSGTDSIAAMVVVGVPFEDLRIVTKRIIDLAHITGSIIPVSFQYVPAVHNTFSFGRDTSLNGNNPLTKFVSKNLNSPEKLNSKLYPFAKISGYHFEDYVELTRLTTLLNSKYRGTTFDFLGDSFTAKRFRESIRTKGWDPFKNTHSNEAILINDLLLKSEKK